MTIGAPGANLENEAELAELDAGLPEKWARLKSILRPRGKAAEPYNAQRSGGETVRLLYWLWGDTLNPLLRSLRSESVADSYEWHQ